MNVPFPDTNMGAPTCEFYPQRKTDVRVLFDLRIPGAGRDCTESVRFGRSAPISRQSTRTTLP